MHRLFSAIVLFVLLGYHGGAFAAHTAARILILGDSLSAAYNMPIEQGWPQLFRTNIRASFPQTTVINASISGETTFGGLQRLPQLLDEHSPTHLIIEVGGNDGLRGLDFRQTTDNLRQMIGLAKARGIVVLLIGVRMPPNFGAAYNARFQQVFESVAAEFAVDYLPKFLDGVAAGDPGLMQDDGIHPTARAQPILAGRVEERMRQILSH